MWSWNFWIANAYEKIMKFILIVALNLWKLFLIAAIRLEQVFREWMQIEYTSGFWFHMLRVTLVEFQILVASLNMTEFGYFACSFMALRWCLSLGEISLLFSYMIGFKLGFSFKDCTCFVIEWFVYLGGINSEHWVVWCFNFSIGWEFISVINLYAWM